MIWSLRSPGPPRRPLPIWVWPGLLASCDRQGGGARCEPASDPLLVVATTDFAVGALATLGLEAQEVRDLLVPTSGDPLVVAAGDRVYQVDRGSGDAVRRYRPGCWAAPEQEFALPPGANAHDLELVGDELWVSAYELDHLLILGSDGTRLGRVSLAEHADADGLPEADGLVATGGRLYVALQKLARDDGWTDAGGLIAEVDPLARVVTRAWPVGADPKVFLHPARPGTLAVLTGRYFAPDGALSVLDPAEGSLEAVISEEELGFDLGGYAELGGVGVLFGPGFAIGDPSGLVCLDWATGERLEGPSTSAWYVDARPAGDLVWLASRSGFERPGSGDGLLPLDPAACRLRGAPVELVLEPYSLALAPGPGAGMATGGTR